MRIALNPSSVDDYRLFLRIKQLPKYEFEGFDALVPDEYAGLLGVARTKPRERPYKPSEFLFDYQADIARTAIHKRKFAAFVDCGLGKTLIMGEFVRHVAGCLDDGKRVLIVSPLMVVDQTMAEFEKFCGSKMPVERLNSRTLTAWLRGGPGEKIGIVNYDALNDETPSGCLGAMVLDESSMLKSQYGKWGQTCIRIGRGLEWKLCLTGTPAPNDRIEYGNHAVFLDQFPTLNSFLARFFVNRGQTDNRWELKAHALEPFYRALSHWSIFLTNPATYGWKDNTANVPPIEVHIDRIDMTAEQWDAMQTETGNLFATGGGGITQRTRMARIAKGTNGIATNKPEFIRKMVERFAPESVIIWCLYNEEQDGLASILPDAANISGDTPHEKRMALIEDFKAGRRRVLISKPKILGFGLNLQIATRHIFSGLQDSYESYYQAVKRSNRYGSTKPLNVHIPITEIEQPMVATVLEKAKRVQQDTEEQERIFRKSMVNGKEKR